MSNAAADEAVNYACLKLAIDQIDNARLHLNELIVRGTFPRYNRVLRQDGALRDAVAGLRGYLRECQQAADKKGTVL